jgi:hypothetical protein
MSGQNAILNVNHWGQKQGFRPPGTVFASSSTLPLAGGLGHPPFSAAGVFTTVPQRHLNFRMPPLQTDEELANLQKLSNEFEPEIEVHSSKPLMWSE